MIATERNSTPSLLAIPHGVTKMMTPLSKCAEHDTRSHGISEAASDNPPDPPSASVGFTLFRKKFSATGYQLAWNWEGE